MLVNLLLLAAVIVVSLKLGARVIGSIPELVQNGRQAVAARNAQRADAQRRTDWSRYARMPRAIFVAEMRRRAARIDRLTRRADACYREADWLEASWLHDIPIVVPMIVAHWRKLADRCVTAAYAAQDEESRILDLMRVIEAARGTQQRDSNLANGRYLLKLLDSSNDVAAQTALERLNLLRTGIEWLDLIPRQMPESNRAQAAKLLRLAAATPSLNESRAALAKFKHLLRASGLTFDAVFA